MNKPLLKPVQEPSPAGRVDVLIERLVDRWMKLNVDNHPLTLRLKEVGLDSSSIVREAVKEKIKTDRGVKRLNRGLKKVMKALQKA
jgi:hypothetical protein